MAKVVIVGTRGSGKTTLMTVLAKRYQTSLNGISMIAKDRQTMEFTERNWRMLTQNQEWPPQTPPGLMLKLQWSLQAFGNDSHDIQMVDFAGETFRDIFGKSNLCDAANRSAAMGNPDLSPLIQCLDEADAVLVLLNLRDFLNEQDEKTKYETQWALRGVLDYVQSVRNIPQDRISVFLTQIDEYAGLLDKRANWAEVITEHLPHLQIVQSYPNLYYQGVSAVYETTIKDIENGQTIVCPAINFNSLYLDKIVSFINNSAGVAKPQSLPYESTAVLNNIKRRVLASRISRLRAFLIDNLVVYLGPTLGFVLFQSYSWVIVSIWIMWINSWLLATRGQTVGKIVLKIMVVDTNTATIPNFWKVSALRYILFSLMYCIPLFGLLLGIADALFIFKDDRRCLHDLAAGTVVVPLAKKPDPEILSNASQ